MKPEDRKFVLDCLKKSKQRICVICEKKNSYCVFTCSKKCHAKFVRELVKRFGKFKKVIVEEKAYKVPLIDIIEKGLKGWEIPLKYELWDDKN